MSKETLMIGSHGDDVQELQRFLKVLGHYRGDSGGKFDADTADAVSALQSELKLIGSGAFDAATVIASGDMLSQWVGTLRCLGFLQTDNAVSATRALEEAVVTFQNEQKLSDRNIVANGVLDKATRVALAAELATLQSKLYFLGHYKGFVDGKFNPFIIGAIRDFQIHNKIVPSGVRDGETRLAIIHKALIDPKQPGLDDQEKIVAIQRKLYCCGVYHGVQDGDYNNATREAVAEFQHEMRLHHAQTTLRGDGLCDDHTWWLLNQEAGTTFAESFQWELDALDVENTNVIPDKADPRPAADSTVAKRAHENHLFGLAFSGGGIRSATFNLGISQAFAEQSLLGKFHYLSTVSGGGYIGSWLSRWIHEENGDVATVEAKLRRESATRTEPDQVKFLRQYSNFLTPKVGLLGADTWAVVATYLRNVMLNMVIFVAVLSVAMLLPRVLLWLVTRYSVVKDSITLYTPGYALWFGDIALLAFLIAVFFISLHISLVFHTNNKNRWLYHQEQFSVLMRVVVPLMVAGFCGSVWLWYEYDGAQLYLNDWSFRLIATAIYLMVWGVAWRLGQQANRANGISPARSGGLWSQVWPHLAFSIIALVLGHTLITVVLELFQKLTLSSSSLNHPVNLVAFGMPVALAIFGVSMVLLVGLLGRAYGDRSREWWSRMGGWTIILTTCWVLWFVICLYGPPTVIWWVQEKGGVTGSMSLALGWILPSLGGIMFGKSANSDAPKRLGYNKILIAIAPPIFVLGLTLVIAIGIQLLINTYVQPIANLPESCTRNPMSLGTYFDKFFCLSEILSIYALLKSIFLCALVAGVLAWRVDINKFSLYMMYRNRLVRCYLGASNPKRQPHPFVGFDAADDPHLAEMLWKKEKPESAVRHLQKPFHLINTALNLVKGKELAWQDRKAASFTFSPGFCGFELPPRAGHLQPSGRNDLARGCFRTTREYGAGKRDPVGGTEMLTGLRSKIELFKDEEEGVKLGQAMAISGAAASPNMGYHSSPALSFLMTAFNVRLGRWNANPRQDAWRKSSPTFGLGCLVKELLGSTDADSRYVYLSDGGHFENLGVYELVRRRCVLIVAIDSGADGGTTFNDLGNAMRKCFTDFGIEIDVHVKDLQLDPATGLAKSHWAFGEIKYGLVDANCESGMLLYVKPSLTGNEPADVLNYRNTDKNFPHQSTADQFFDETQFESYRKLGFHIGSSLSATINAELEDTPVIKDSRRTALLRRLFGK